MELAGIECFPRFVKISRDFPDKSLKDIVAATHDAMFKSGVADRIKPAFQIAITAGSRGIYNLPPVLRAIGDVVRSKYATPFIVPAMGSHGGATAEGQKAILNELGVTEETTGMPIRSSMDTIELGRTASGAPVYIDKIAFDCDGVIAVNRVKPHTSLVGALGSGISKMLVVGLGKKRGATAFHRLGPIELERALPEMARMIIDKAPIIGGVGLVEDAYDKTAIIKGAAPDDILKVDEELANEALNLMPRLPFDEIDVLVLYEMGKHISGVGMDTNVIGRRGIRLVPDAPSPRIKRIVVLRLSEHSRGNAHGVGLADIVTKKLADAIDWSATSENGITSAFPEKCALPLNFPNDRDAIAAALTTAWAPELTKARMVVAQNTLKLDKLYISESLVVEAKKTGGIKILAEPEPLQFDEKQEIILGWLLNP